MTKEKLYLSALDDYYQSKSDSQHKKSKDTPRFTREIDSTSDCINLIRNDGNKYRDLEISLQKAEYIPHKCRKLTSDINDVSQKLHRIKIDMELGYTKSVTEQQRLEQRLQKLILARQNLLENKIKHL